MVDGEFAPDVGFASKLQDYFTQLGNWSFLGQDLDILYQDCVSIDAATGVVTVAQPITVSAGDTVQFQNVIRNSTFEKLSFKAKVTTGIVAGLVFAIQSPPALGTTKGKVRRVAYKLFTMDATTAQATRATVRKVGRPFGQYRGRRSRRKILV
jgi:hypothetical protein